VARKTIKGLEVIITDLEKRLNEQNKINVELHNKISQMQMIADDKFENSTNEATKNPIIKNGTYSILSITLSKSPNPTAGKIPPAISNPCFNQVGILSTKILIGSCATYVHKNTITP